MSNITPKCTPYGLQYNDYKCYKVVRVDDQGNLVSVFVNHPSWKVIYKVGSMIYPNRVPSKLFVFGSEESARDYISPLFGINLFALKLFECEITYFSRHAVNKYVPDCSGLSLEQAYKLYRSFWKHELDIEQWPHTTTLSSKIPNWTLLCDGVKLTKEIEI